MIRHVLLWQFKDEYSAEQKAELKSAMKRELEALVGVVPGLQELTIVTDDLETSNADVMLDSTLTDMEAYRGYIVHPDHVAAAVNYVRPFMKTRLCFDYEI